MKRSLILLIIIMFLFNNLLILYGCSKYNKYTFDLIEDLNNKGPDAILIKNPNELMAYFEKQNHKIPCKSLSVKINEIKQDNNYFNKYALILISFAYTSSESDIELSALKENNNELIVIFNIKSPKNSTEDLLTKGFFIEIDSKWAKSFQSIAVKVNNLISITRGSYYYNKY